MTNLLDCIRIATAEGATPEEKQAGAAACCAIYASLSPPPGVPITVPHAPRSAVNLDQVLDLAVSKLRSLVPPGAEVHTTSLRFPFLSQAGKP
jgi:hypothetical protein